VLNRTTISSGRYLEYFKDLPEHIRWKPEQIERSMRETMDLRPATGEPWLFGYGSLIWNPVCRFEARRRATLQGWHRSFCLRIVAGRASPLMPGRMWSLEPGGRTQGIAFRLPTATLAEELRLVWIREMLTGAYVPTWSTVTLDDGSHATALTFVARQGHPLHEQDASVLSVAPLVATASGPLGTNAEYLFRLKAALTEWRVSDDYIDALADAVTSLQRVNASPDFGIGHTYPSLDDTQGMLVKNP
jgi:cation transport protein ChaC